MLTCKLQAHAQCGFVVAQYRRQAYVGRTLHDEMHEMHDEMHEMHEMYEMHDEMQEFQFQSLVHCTIQVIISRAMTWNTYVLWMEEVCVLMCTTGSIVTLQTEHLTGA